ncbi:3-deoxy-8-phosphooctulonate synthase [Deferribacterales bacterium RsTz2092]
MDLYSTIKAETFIIAGPCVMEDVDIMMTIGETCKQLCAERGLTYIFKVSFDKANRTSAKSYRGVGLENGLQLLQEMKDVLNVPITTDIHESYQAEPVSRVADILQIPAFLCRQTDLLLAAAKTGKIVNIKKAQFLSAQEMVHPIDKVRGAGNDNIIITERGTMFGYNNLVVDFRNLVDMRTLGVPVCMDVTHSTQRPGGLGGKSGGDSKYAPYMASAAAAVGADGFFFEVHPEPERALSDGPNMVRLADFAAILDKVIYHSK